MIVSQPLVDWFGLVLLLLVQQQLEHLQLGFFTSWQVDKPLS
jgi:hypothetical protein